MTDYLLSQRLNIFTGHFGSGKTEVAIKFAIKAARRGKKVIIVDLDIVNTYFRTLDAKKALEAEGVKVISTQFANTNLDMPTVPSEVYGALQDKDAIVVLDVGGDENGALVLGQYNRYFKNEPYNMFFVINALRPLTQTPEDICVYLDEIQNASRLKATALVNNTNLSYDSSIGILLDGQKVVEGASALSGIPLAFISGKDSIIKMLPKELSDKAFGLDLFLQLPFL